jgi:hypothetical protein
MHSDWFNGIDILQGRWQHGEKVGYCYPSGLEKTLCKWGVYVPLVTKGLSALEKLLRATVTFVVCLFVCPSVRPSVRMENLAPTGRMFMKSDI